MCLLVDSGAESDQPDGFKDKPEGARGLSCASKRGWPCDILARVRSLDASLRDFRGFRGVRVRVRNPNTSQERVFRRGAMCRVALPIGGGGGVWGASGTPVRPRPARRTGDSRAYRWDKAKIKRW